MEMEPRSRFLNVDHLPDGDRCNTSTGSLLSERWLYRHANTSANFINGTANVFTIQSNTCNS
jgi:hypothetical protein